MPEYSKSNLTKREREIIRKARAEFAVWNESAPDPEFEAQMQAEGDVMLAEQQRINAKAAMTAETGKKNKSIGGS